jgi:hypothetical protein
LRRIATQVIPDSDLAKSHLALDNAVMNVSLEQLEAIERGEAVAVTLDHTECVILRRDLFEKVRFLIDYSEMPPEEAYDAVADAWGDEGLEAYQDYKCK